MASEYDPALAILVSANDVSRLRRVDVFRVLEWAPDEHRAAVAAYIVANRADLSQEVADIMAELYA